MPNTYASKLIELLGRTGQPQTTTSTSKGTSTVTVPDEGFDISSLISMLMMSQMFKQPKPFTPIETLGTTSAPAGFNPLSVLPKTSSAFGYTASPPSQLEQPMDLMQLLKMLASIKI